jgi:hypothetical protein
MYTPTSNDEQRIRRLEAQLMQAPKKQSVYYHQAESQDDMEAELNNNYYCNTSGYENYLNEIKNVQISNGPFLVLRNQR